KPKKYVRTSCFRKDVFIFDKDNLLEMPVTVTTVTGLEFFKKTGLEVRVIYDPSLYNNNQRVINFNHGSHHGGDQHGILLEKGISEAVGHTVLIQPAGLPPPEAGPPGQIVKCVIDVGKCTAAGSHPNTLAAAIAHELGHAVNILHHGTKKVTHHCNAAPTYNPAPGITERLPTIENSEVTSGNMDCVMRYPASAILAFGWCDTNHSDFHPYYDLTIDPAYNVHYTIKDNSRGTNYCESPNGTDLNVDKAKRNDAATGRGNCKSQIRVKDWGP
ncbi:MAG: hypothetical protein ACT4N1_07100, partial [Nitrososphaerota archaeon]